MRMLSFEEFVVALENELEDRARHLQEQLSKYMDLKTNKYKPNLTPEEIQKANKLIRDLSVIYGQLNADQLENLMKKQEEKTQSEHPSTSHDSPHTTDEEEISRFKKMGKWMKEHPYKTGGGALGATAAVGGLAYGGYKLLHRKDSSNEGMLSFEGFVIALEDEKTDGRVWDILRKYDSLQKRIQDDPNHPESITSKSIIPKYVKEYKELTGRDVHKDWLSYKSILSKARVNEKAKKLFEEHPELKMGWFNDFKGKHGLTLIAAGGLGLGGSTAYLSYKKKKRLREEGKEEESKKHRPLLAALAGLMGGAIGSNILLTLDKNGIIIFPCVRKMGIRTVKDFQRFGKIVEDLAEGKDIHPDDARWIDSIMNKFKEHGEKELEALDKNTRLDRRLKDQLKEFIENTLKVAKQW